MYVTTRDSDDEWYERVVAGGTRIGSGEEFKRYLPIGFTFDTRFHLLEDVKDSWDPVVREQALGNQKSIIQGIANDYGPVNIEQKVENFRDLGRAAWSVVAGHSLHMRQVRDAFIATHYYPALLGACALGERILNQLISTLKDDYRDHPATAKVARKSSVDNWPVAIKTLQQWGILDDAGTRDFLNLGRLRNRAVHYSPSLDISDAREEALTAITVLRDVVERLFRPFGTGPSFFTGPIGRSYIRRESESDPLIRHFFLPASALVSPAFEFRPTADLELDAYDRKAWVGPASLTDEEYANWRPPPTIPDPDGPV